MRIRAWAQQHRIPLLLLGASVVIHLVVSIFLFARFGDNILFFENEDAHSYVNLGKSLAAGEGFAKNGIPSATRTPVYPLLLSSIYSLGLPPIWSILILHNLLASATVILLFLVGKLFFSPRVGIIASVLYMIEPYILMSSNLATTETLFNFLLVAGVYGIGLYSLRSRQYRYLVAAGLCVGLAILTRPVALYLPVFIVFFLLVSAYLRREGLRQTIIALALFAGITIAVVTPWLARQQHVFGRARITNIDAHMLYYRVAPLIIARTDGVDLVRAVDILAERLRSSTSSFDLFAAEHTFRYYDWMVGESKRLVAAHPGVVARTYVISLIPALTGTGYEYMLETIFALPRDNARPSYTLLLSEQGWRGIPIIFEHMDIFQFVLFGSILLWLVVYFLITMSLLKKDTWRQYWQPLFLLIITAGYCILFTLGPSVHARYRMPSFPFLFLLLAFALDFFLKRRILRGKPNS